jgi:hypothetical protein
MRCRFYILVVSRSVSQGIIHLLFKILFVISNDMGLLLACFSKKINSFLCDDPGG